jgi:murein DD-endopeptidase MepM/ murein hydrolase activator NlpD
MNLLLMIALTIVAATGPHPAPTAAPLPGRSAETSQYRYTAAPARSPELAVWPLEATPRNHPEIAAGFVAPDSAWSAGHRGVDLIGNPGEPVRTALPGTVSFSGTIAGRGVVVVNHGRLRTTYEPVAGTVQVGQPLAAGDVLGTLEVVGGHCPPRTCLHWGLLTGTEYLDPLSLFGLGPVRLLPLQP